jgi:hypothetical protein
VNFDGQARPGHTDGIVYAVLIVNNEFLRQPIHNFPASGKLNRASRIDGPTHIVMAYFPVAAGHGNNRLTVEAHDVRAREIYGHFLCLDTAHSFRIFNRPSDSFDCRIRIYDHTFAKATGFRLADTKNLEHAFLSCSGDDAGRFTRTDIQADSVICPFRHFLFRVTSDDLADPYHHAIVESFR